MSIQNHIKILRQSLVDGCIALEKGEMSSAKLNAIANSARQYIYSIRAELDIYKATGQDPNIQLLLK